jgi:hypothetical protein
MALSVTVSYLPTREINMETHLEALAAQLLSSRDRGKGMETALIVVLPGAYLIAGGRL